MLDHHIAKPASVQVYDLHQLVESLTAGEHPQFFDDGEKVIIRSNAELTSHGTKMPEFEVGDMTVFRLRACCFAQSKKKRHYYPLSEWRSRHEWLKRRAVGFEVMQLHCRAKSIKIKAGKMDQTDFTGVLKVTDKDKFTEALRSGIAGCPKAFGFGMLVLN